MQSRSVAFIPLFASLRTLNFSKPVSTSQVLLFDQEQCNKKCNGSPACAAHQVILCPVCDENGYLKRRICKVVSGALRRMKLQKKKSFLEYLGAESWEQVQEYLQAKKEHWNQLHPNVPMTLTNTALDHIRPVSLFKKSSIGAQEILCNHYTNLQPLLHEDNIWKGDSWSFEDEKKWQDKIIMQPLFNSVYYPKTAPSQPSLLRSKHHSKNITEH